VYCRNFNILTNCIVEFRCSDGGIFAESGLGKAFEEGKAGLPPPSPLPHDDQEIPFSIVADDAFPLRSWLLKPYPQRFMTRDQRLFNYRLSRARRVVENAFGILAHRYHKTLSCLFNYKISINIFSIFDLVRLLLTSLVCKN
jgi:hypothetical protein